MIFPKKTQKEYKGKKLQTSLSDNCLLHNINKNQHMSLSVEVCKYLSDYYVPETSITKDKYLFHFWCHEPVSEIHNTLFLGSITTLGNVC